ncbi:MAG: PAS domain S-box protein [Desulfobacteraceae bacterium]|nr:PAS domain S-box protein [Desulfobacteraceae bacterium]
MGNDTTIEQLEKRIERLEKKNRELTEIIYKAPIPIFVIDKDHLITHFNEALEELTGLRAQDMVGTDQQWKAFYLKTRPVMADLIINQSTDAQIVEHYGLKYNRTTSKSKERFAATDFFQDLSKDGKWLSFTASPIKDKEGNITGSVETLQDVTEEKIAERKIRELYRQYRMILEFVPYPIAVYDDDGRVSYINPAFTSTFGWPLEEIKGEPIPFVPEELKEETGELLNKFRENKALTRYETQRLTKDGKILDVVLWAASYGRFRQNTTENFVILRDITEEKRLAANNQTLMRISMALPEFPELDQLMNFISKEVKEILNTEGALVLLYDEIKDEVFFLGAAYDNTDTEKRVKKIRFPLDEVFAGEIIKSGQPAIINDPEISLKHYPQRDKKLGYKTRNILEVPIKSDGRTIGVLCAMNKKKNLFEENDMELMTMISGAVAISIENARFSEEIRTAYRDVASMNRAKGKAINHLSHELKTPVAVLNGSLQILRKKLEASPVKAWETTLGRIERNLNRIVEIQDETADIMHDKTYSAQKLLLKMLEVCQDELETLIEMNKDSDDFIESVRKLIDKKFGPRGLYAIPINPGQYCQTLFEKIRSEFDFRKVNITLDIKENLPLVHIPEEILEKVVVGLIKNAIENTPDQGKIEVSVDQNEDGIYFGIHDFGVGIEEDNQKRIFEGFFSTQETLLYSTKRPYDFNAGGKGADLLRMKIFSDRFGFSMEMNSKHCIYLNQNKDYACPGNIDQCTFCGSQSDCIASGYTIFKVVFPS